jgi:2,4-dienoyl-CoA reductase-like NADH-dependent reductase (Old Yellow Enzyme family)
MAGTDLFAPLTFRNGVCARNRVVVAPMTNQQSHADGSLSDDELRWLALRAEGGFGVVETCAAHVALDGQGWEGELGIFDDRLLPGLTRLAGTLRTRGALGIVQIFHGGARSPAKLIGQRPFSASEIEGDPAQPRAATSDDIARVIVQFRDAAVRAHRAGFEGVELHGAHGYLLNQFLSAYNRREDAYGGAPFENRARLLREATRAVRAAVPASFVVGVRISPEDFGNSKGIDIDESLTLASWLADDGIDFLHISLWDSFANTKKRPEEHAVPLFRRALPAEIPLLVAGGVWTREQAETLLARGADAVALGRAAIVNPDWPASAEDPVWQPRRPPLTTEELRERGLSDGFIQYMRRWKGFVSDAAAG